MDKFRDFFYSTCDDYSQYHKQEFEVIREIGADEFDREDVGRMFEIKFSDGTVIEAFADEVLKSVE